MPASAQSCSAISDTARKTPSANSETSDSAGGVATGFTKGTSGMQVADDEPDQQAGHEERQHQPEPEHRRCTR